MDTQQKMAKTFWQKPEGTTGKILMGAGILVGVFATWTYLPIITAWLAMVLANTFTACLFGAGTLAITSPIWNSKVRALTGYMLRSVLRGITKFFVEIDPIGILKNYVEDLRKYLAVMDKQLENLWGQITRLRRDIAENKAEAAHSLALAGVAQKQGKKAAFVLNARNKGRLEESNVTLQTMLTKLREASDVMVQDMTADVRVKEKERKAILAAYGALTSAKKILSGDPDKRALFDQAMEFLAEDYANKVGEIDQFMKVSQGFIEGVDLENGVFEQSALDALTKQLDEKTEQLLLPPGQRVRVDTNTQNAQFAQAATEAAEDDVANLFKTETQKKR